MRPRFVAVHDMFNRRHRRIIMFTMTGKVAGPSTVTGNSPSLLGRVDRYRLGIVARIHYEDVRWAQQLGTNLMQIAFTLRALPNTAIAAAAATVVVCSSCSQTLRVDTSYDRQRQNETDVHQHRRKRLHSVLSSTSHCRE